MIYIFSMKDYTKEMNFCLALTIEILAPEKKNLKKI